MPHPDDFAVVVTEGSDGRRCSFRSISCWTACDAGVRSGSSSWREELHGRIGRPTPAAAVGLLAVEAAPLGLPMKPMRVDEPILGEVPQPHVERHRRVLQVVAQPLVGFEQARPGRCRWRRRGEPAPDRAGVRWPGAALRGADRASRRQPPSRRLWRGRAIRESAVDRATWGYRISSPAACDAAMECSMHVLRGHRGPVVGLAYSPDGKTLASASARGWDGAAVGCRHRTRSAQDAIAVRSRAGVWRFPGWEASCGRL